MLSLSLCARGICTGPLPYARRVTKGPPSEMSTELRKKRDSQTRLFPHSLYNFVSLLPGGFLCAHGGQQIS